MSDTPRTDAAAIRCACSTYVVPTEFAQQLERELKEKWEALFDMGKNISQLERENAALRAALVECKDTLVEYVHGDIENPPRMNSTLNIVRAAINAARKGAQP